MAGGKWITGLRADTPLIEAAERVLRARLKTIQHFLPLAAKDLEKDVEHVHQVRVGSRRAAAALDLFEDCLAEKRSRALRKRLKKIRRAAGNARDWDVFQINLLAWSEKRPAAERPGLQFLRGVAFERRSQAQEELAKLADTQLEIDNVIEHLHAPENRDGSGTLAHVALPFLEELLTDFHAAVDADTGDYAHLHRIRIAGKRLRYGMEICVSCFRPSFRDAWYPAIEEMQEILGTANDSHVTERWLAELCEQVRSLRPADWRVLRPGIERLLRAQQRNLPAQRQRFAAWLKRWRRLYRPLPELVSPVSKVKAET